MTETKETTRLWFKEVYDTEVILASDSIYRQSSFGNCVIHVGRESKAPEGCIFYECTFRLEDGIELVDYLGAIAGISPIHILGACGDGFTFEHPEALWGHIMMSDYSRCFVIIEGVKHEMYKAARELAVELGKLPADPIAWWKDQEKQMAERRAGAAS